MKSVATVSPRNSGPQTDVVGDDGEWSRELGNTVCANLGQKELWKPRLCASKSASWVWSVRPELFLHGIKIVVHFKCFQMESP